MKNNKSSVERKCRVLLFYRKMIPSICLCGYELLRYLADAGRIELRSQAIRELTEEDLHWADVVLLGRCDSWAELRIAQRLKRAKKYLVYIVDDDLLNTPETITSSKHFGLKSVRRNIETIMELSDAILSPSPILLEKYAKNGQMKIRIEEPAVHIASTVPQNPEWPVKIGFAGSIDRVTDLENLLGAALKSIKQRYRENVSFEFFGAIPNFAKELDAISIPYYDSYEKYLQTLESRRWDIGLAPMPETDFHKCKHYIKFVEYGSMGIVGVFSDVLPYQRLREKSVPAIYCSNQQEAWEKAICQLIENPEKRNDLRQKVWNAIRTEYSTTEIARRFWNENQKIFEYHAICDEKHIPVTAYKAIDALVRMMLTIKSRGWKTPQYVFQRLTAAIHK